MGFRYDHDPILPVERAEVFFDGVFTEPRLQHPEGVAVDADGAVWCGSENGEILRIDPDGNSIRRMASSGGFTLGLAFDHAGHLYACDSRAACIHRLDLAKGRLERFAGDGIRIPNFPVVDAARGCLYVSDSHDFNAAGPGVWRYDLATGAGSLWFAEPMTFANGMALAPDGGALYVVETFAHQVRRFAIGADGAVAGDRVFVDQLPGLPDGLAFDPAGHLLISFYEPSRIARVDPDGRWRVLIDDPTAHILCHPTNIAFRGERELFTANLGRWHITRIAL